MVGCIGIKQVIRRGEQSQQHMGKMRTWEDLGIIGEILWGGATEKKSLTPVLLQHPTILQHGTDISGR